MPNVREPIKTSSRQKKQKIIDTGFKLMCEKGYHNVSCIDIARASNVSTGIIYQYFNDKLDIFIAGAKIYSQKILFPVLSATKNRQITRDNFDLILREMIREIISAYTSSKNFHQEFRLMSCLNKEVADIFNYSEEQATEELVNQFPNCSCIKEKVHLMINLIDNLCHELICHQHQNYDYEFMQEETIRLIKFMMEDVYEN